MNISTTSSPAINRCLLLFAFLCIALTIPAWAGGGSAKANNIVKVKNISVPLAALPQVAIETVEVGDAGNQPSSLPEPSLVVGGVTNSFRIGKFEVSVAQYVAFLNAVAAVTNTTSATLYSVQLMGIPANVSGIMRTGAGTPADPFIYAASGNANHPIAYVDWFDAARFANWMHNGATNGANTEDGAYTLNGQTLDGSGIVRNPGAKWWIPSEDEWFKAAFYRGGGATAGYHLFATKSDATPGNSLSAGGNQANFRRFGQTFAVTQSVSYDPVQIYLTPAGFFSNSISAYGTFDQNGNVAEWTDTAVAAEYGNARVVRGGSWSDNLNTNYDPRSLNLPRDALNTIGFRLACRNSPNSGPEFSGSVLVSVASSPVVLIPPKGEASFRVRPGQYKVTAQAQSSDPALQANLPISTTNFPTSTSNRTTGVTVEQINGVVVITNL